MNISSFLTKKFLKSLFFPAHHRGAALPKKLVKLLKNQPGYWDLPELPEIGSPLSQSGLIAKTQRELSEKFGAKGCFFGVNGASGLIQSAVIAMANPGETILMPRNVHISVIKICAMQNIQPIFFDLDFSSETGHYKPITKNWLKNYLIKNSDNGQYQINYPFDTEFFESIERIEIIACGTSKHAAMVGSFLLEQFSGIPTNVFYASEFRYSPPPLLPNTLTIGVTQSGETADTIAAIDMEIKRRSSIEDKNFKPNLIAITNRKESSIGRQISNIIDICAGIEVGVAATKTFFAQLLSFYGLAIKFAEIKGSKSSDQINNLINELIKLPPLIEDLLEKHNKSSEKLAHDFFNIKDVIFLGRGINYPIALEGALKLKEISYIHAAGYPAGEMKHGPIALLDKKVPVISIASPGEVFDKVISNAQEAKARDAYLIGIAPECNGTEIFDYLMKVPSSNEWISPLLNIVPLQLLSYHIAAHRGLDVDQPRNLAKSVTVE